MTTAWGQFRNFINSKEVGYTFTRQKLFDSLRALNPATIDGYRCLAQQAKFVERVGRGRYKIANHLPEGLTMGSLFALLRGDNLTYIEEIQKQKELNVIKQQFNKDRREVLKHLIVQISQHIPYAEAIESSAFGLKQLIRSWKWELSKEKNPTKNWSERRNK